METLAKINQFTRESYNKAAQKYYDLFHNELEGKKFDKDYLDKFLRLFNSNSLICSVGCGPCGHVEKYIYDKGFRVIGIDISEKCIEIASNNNPQIKFEVGDLSKIKYEDNYFDGIVSYYSILDTPKIYLDKIFNEFYRVLKPGGYLLLVVKEGSTERYESNLLGIETKIYFSLFTEDEIRTVLVRNGFDIEQMTIREPNSEEIRLKRLFAIGKKVI